MPTAPAARAAAVMISHDVDFHVQREGDVVAHQFKIGVFPQVRDVAASAGVEVIYAQHVVAEVEQAVAQMGAEEAGSAGDHDA